MLKIDLEEEVARLQRRINGLDVEALAYDEAYKALKKLLKEVPEPGSSWRTIKIPDIDAINRVVDALAARFGLYV